MTLCEETKLPLFLMLLKKIKLHFTSLNYIPDYDLHHKLRISI